MKAQKAHRQKNRRVLVAGLSGFMIVCLLIGTVSSKYYISLQKTLKEESGGYLQEISKLLGDNVNRIIDDNFSLLGTINMALEDAGDGTAQQLKFISSNQKKYWGYDHLYLVDAKGVAYDSEGHSISLGSETFLQDVIVKNKPSMSSTVVVEGQDSVIFAIPSQGLSLEGIEICAIATSYDLSTFDQVLSMTAFGGEAYGHIIKPDGSVVIRSSSQNADKSGYNILNSLKAEKNDSESNLEKIKSDIAQGKSGMGVYTLDGVKKYMAYTPLASQEWSLVTFVPVSVVSAKSEILLKITVLLCGFITFTFGALLVILASSFYRHKGSLEQIAYVDPITGGNTIQKFYEDAKKRLDKPLGKVPYCIMYMNVEKFKLLNEQYGKKSCDE
ncbi:MAG: hypothetical protein RR253_02305, partial [Oscillospiraceae bacterium]